VIAASDSITGHSIASTFREFPKHGGFPLRVVFAVNYLNGAYPSTTLSARPEFYRRNKRKSEPVMVIPRPGSELKAVEEACRETSRTVEPLNGLDDLNVVILFVN
jgi:hypothetical protein